MRSECEGKKRRRSGGRGPGEGRVIDWGKCGVVKRREGNNTGQGVSSNWGRGGCYRAKIREVKLAVRGHLVPGGLQVCVNND